jgi:hypothetical protein
VVEDVISVSAHHELHIFRKLEILTNREIGVKECRSPVLIAGLGWERGQSIGAYKFIAIEALA